MKIQYASDLHLEFAENWRFLKENPLQVTGDILVLAGDIGYLGDENYSKHPFWDWASENYQQVIASMGNHEFYKEYTDFNEETIADADILYMTRVQRERFTDLMEYERVKDVYILRNKMLEHTRPNLRILHPLPRVNEIAYDVDENPKAYYFQQAQNGLYARQAILCDVLGITLNDVIEDAKK